MKTKIKRQEKNIFTLLMNIKREKEGKTMSIKFYFDIFRTLKIKKKI